VEIVIADLTKEGEKDDEKNFLPELDRFKNISIVVNNAGVTSLNKYTDIKPSYLLDLLNINCFALAALCHRFIPQFEKRTKETGKKCAFINLGSITGSRHEM
jgi:short-subunit dehydrogenase